MLRFSLYARLFINIDMRIFRDTAFYNQIKLHAGKFREQPMLRNEISIRSLRIKYAHRYKMSPLNFEENKEEFHTTIYKFMKLIQFPRQPPITRQKLLHSLQTNTPHIPHT